MKVCRDELEARGWTRVPAIDSRDALLGLARSIGVPLPAPTGELVKRIPVTSASHAKRRTLSAAHGSEEFPLHTDTAFWPVPARYVVLRAVGDLRRYTTIRSFEHLFNAGRDSLLDLVKGSVWVVRTPSTSFYSGMNFHTSSGVGWRYDHTCMFPANRLASVIRERLDFHIARDRGDPIVYAPYDAIVISNWTALHGRGPAPAAEGLRVLERVYVG
jgi:hypothetical protein